MPKRPRGSSRGFARARARTTSFEALDDRAIANPAFMGGLLLALAGLASAWSCRRNGKTLLAAAYYLAFRLRFLDAPGGIPDRYDHMLGHTIGFVVLGQLVVFYAFGLYEKWLRSNDFTLTAAPTGIVMQQTIELNTP